VDWGARVGGGTLLMSSSLVSIYEMESSGTMDAARGWKVLWA
jgi:hypothetical protein